jgi:hypothetical protein
LSAHFMSELSGRSITNTYDVAGQTVSFTGNLGDGSSRTYANNIAYSPLAALQKSNSAQTRRCTIKLSITFEGNFSIRGSAASTIRGIGIAGV